jgi:hypothetical protein
MRSSLFALTLALALVSGRAALGDEPAPGAPPPPPVPAVDAAAPAQEEGLATELFNAARELMVAGQHAEACAKLVESARLSLKVGTLGKLAECDEKLGHLVAARAHFQQAQDLARAQGDARLEIVERELARVDALVPRLVLSAGASPPPGMAVSVDGVALGTSAVGTPIPLDPGRHTVLVTAPGKRQWTAVVELKADGKSTTFSVPELADAAAGAATSKGPEGPAPAPGGRSGLAVAGILATGVGAGALSVGAFFGGRAQAKVDESNRAGCLGTACSPDAARIRNEARAAGDVATALVIAGGAALAGGIALWIAAPGPRAAAAAKPRVGMSLSINAVSIHGSW